MVPAQALGSQGKRLRGRALLSDSDDEDASVQQQQRERSLAPEPPAEAAAAVDKLRETCKQLQADLDRAHKAQEDRVSGHCDWGRVQQCSPLTKPLHMHDAVLCLAFKQMSLRRWELLNLMAFCIALQNAAA